MPFGGAFNEVEGTQGMFPIPSQYLQPWHLPKCPLLVQGCAPPGVARLNVREPKKSTVTHDGRRDSMKA